MKMKMKDFLIFFLYKYLHTLEDRRLMLDVDRYCVSERKHVLALCKICQV